MRLPIEINDLSHDKVGFMRQPTSVLISLPTSYYCHSSGFIQFFYYNGDAVRAKGSITEFNNPEVVVQKT